MDKWLKNISSPLRVKRFSVFEQVTDKFARPLRILDLGGTASFWLKHVPVNDDNYKITLINNHHVDKTNIGYSHSIPWIIEKHADARDSSEWDLDNHDLIFSNSFLEHLESFADQLELASKIDSSQYPYFIQIPNKYFPVDPHFPSPFVPFFSCYPKTIQAVLLTINRFGSGAKSKTYNSAKKRLKYYNPLGLKDARELFPSGIIIKEKTFGLCRSVLIYNI